MNSTMAKFFLRIAIVLTVVFVVLHLLGLRSQVAILSGTLPENEFDIFSGLFYILSWFCFVLVAPILAISSLLQIASTKVLKRFRKSARSTL